MPIQFHCKSCQGWIEVDDEHSGGKAICPFCQAVNGVPGDSRKPQPARPAQESAAGPTGQLQGGKGPHAGEPARATGPEAPEGPVSGPFDQRERERSLPGRSEGSFDRFGAGRTGVPPAPRGNRLTRIGMLGLAGAILSIMLMITPVAIAFRHLPASLQKQILQSQDLTPEQAKDLQKKVMEALTNVANEKIWIERTVSIGVLLWIMSLVLNFSVVFAAGTHRRGYGWAGLMVNSVLLFLCLCSGIMQRFMGS